MKSKLIGLALALVAQQPHAEFFSGNKLLSQCDSPEIILQMDCLGYISGVHDALSGAAICSPPAVTRGQVQDVVLSYLRANPAQRHLTADILIRAALAPLWPCAARQQQQPGRTS